MRLLNTTDPQFACSTITLRNYSLNDALEKAAGMGFALVDFGALAGLCEHVPPNGSTAELRRVGANIRRSGLDFTSVNADPGSFNNPSEKHDEVLHRIVRLLEFCADNGVPRLVLTCGTTESTSCSSEKQLSLLATGLNEAARLAEDFPVELVVEAPHYFRLTNTMARTRMLLDQLSPAIGLAWDVSHVRATGEQPAALFGEFRRRTSIIHLRDATTGDIRLPMGDGDIDFGGVFAEAQAHEYTGPFVLELETHNSPYETKEEEVQASLDYLRTALQPRVDAGARP